MASVWCNLFIELAIKLSSVKRLHPQSPAVTSTYVYTYVKLCNTSAYRNCEWVELTHLCMTLHSLD